MKPITRAILRLYPRVWRDRYRTELETLMDDVGHTWSILPDIFFEAVKMRLTTINWRFTAACAFAGLAIAIVISMRQPVRYESTAFLSAQPGPGDDPLAVGLDTERLVSNAQSRTSLSRIIQLPDLKLYEAERSTTPLEDVVQTMRKDLDLAVQADGSIRIAYRGRSPAEARQTVRNVATRLMDEHQRRQRNLLHLAQANPPDSGTAARLGLGSRVEIAKPPSLPAEPVPTNLWRTAGFGAAMGLLVAVSIGVISRSPRAWLVAGIAASLLGVPYTLAIIFEELPILHYRSKATLEVDSPQTMRALLASAPAGALATAGGRAGTLEIQTTHHNRFAAQRAVQTAITTMVDKTNGAGSAVPEKQWLTGPWIQIIDPPSLPVDPIEGVWLASITQAGLAVTLIAALTLLYNRLRNRRAPATATALD